MFQLMVLTIVNANQLELIMDAWTKAGASGIRLLNGPAPHTPPRDDVPHSLVIHELLEQPKPSHHTIFTVVESHVLAEQISQATQATLGSFGHGQDTFFLTLPVTTLGEWSRN